jgi:hypothetical protein
MRLIADGQGGDAASGREAVKVVSQQGRRSNFGAQGVAAALQGWLAASGLGRDGVLTGVERLLAAAC